MYFDAEMIQIAAIAIFSGVVFYLIAAGPKSEASETPANLCDSRR